MFRMDGLLVIDKPSGMTSHDVVAAARRTLKERRIGHTGTLDPFATGVMLVLVGKATRLAQFLTGEDKEYDAIIRLGYATDTGDRMGKRIAGPNEDESPSGFGKWSDAEIEQALASLRGYIDQVPPMYSAKKIGGRKLYELARRGEEIEREPVRVCIHEFEAIRPDGELVKDNLDGTFDFHVRVVCSAGTYVRALAVDFGKRLSVGAHLAELRRTRVGEFPVTNAVTLDQLKTAFAEEALGTIMLPPSAALSRLPFVHLSRDDVRRARHGMEVKVGESEWSDGEKVRMCDIDDHLIAVGNYDAKSKQLHPGVVLV
ncbi:MAG TPA: tRNA pseudouridine(55) synthase TruB [Pyrinomonadaceae bacterium]|nr:tRNA pseudouridine(55) synthase TruB [Pyrinomonadaceae bacterium]